MIAKKVRAEVADIAADTDPTRKAAKMASLCSALFRERGIELVVVGGSAIELLTEGAYTSGDLDLCRLTPAALPLRERQEIMGQLGAQGGPRSWQVAGLFVDLLGPLETLARTPLRKLQGAYGVIQVAQPEELLVERVLVSVYPQAHPPARDCAKKLAAVPLAGPWSLIGKRSGGLRAGRNTVSCGCVRRLCAKWQMNSKSKAPSIPLNEVMSWEDWLKGRRGAASSATASRPK